MSANTSSQSRVAELAAAAAPAKVVSLIISDVPGDDISVIASGPTAPDVTTSAEALAILDKYKINVPQSVFNHLISNSPKRQSPAIPGLQM